MHSIQKIACVSSQINAITTLECLQHNTMPLAESCNIRNRLVLCCARLDRHALHCRHVRWHAGHCSIQRSLHRRRRQCSLWCVECSASQSPLQVSDSTWLRSFVEWLHANGVTGLTEPEVKLALYEAEHEAGLTERGVIFTEVCQPTLIYTRCSSDYWYPRYYTYEGSQGPCGDAPSSIPDWEPIP